MFTGSALMVVESHKPGGHMNQLDIHRFTYVHAMRHRSISQHLFWLR